MFSRLPSRYEAGTAMKNMCLKQLALGDVLRILNIILTVKKWILHHQSGWQPLKIVLPEANTSSVASDDGWGSGWENALLEANTNSVASNGGWESGWE